jgi:hypothetical protein
LPFSVNALAAVALCLPRPGTVFESQCLYGCVSGVIEKVGAASADKTTGLLD